MFKNVIQFASQWFDDNHLEKYHIHYTSKKLVDIPTEVILASIFLSINALTQFIVDIFIEVASFNNFIPHLETRFNFLTLTFLSALLAFQTLKAIRQKRLDFTRDSAQMGLVIESGLVWGDLVYLNSVDYRTFEVLVRSPFIFFTLINIGLLLYIILKMKLFKWRIIHLLLGDTAKARSS